MEDKIINDKNKTQIVNDFFKDKGIDRKCPICEHETMLIQEEDTVILTRKGNTVLPNNFFPVQFIECAKCGFLMLFKSKKLKLLNDSEIKYMTDATVD